MYSIHSPCFNSLSLSSTLTDAGMVLEWEQATGLLYAGGDVRHIRVWDTHKEVNIQDIPTGADSCVTCLTSDSADRSLLIAGCGDGTIRLYDRRQPPNQRYIVDELCTIIAYDVYVSCLTGQSGSDAERTHQLGGQRLHADPQSKS